MVVKFVLSSTANKKIHGTGELTIEPESTAALCLRMFSPAHLSEYKLAMSYIIYEDRIMLFTTPTNHLSMNMYLLVNLKEMYPSAYYSTVVPVDCGLIKIDQINSAELMKEFNAPQTY